MENLHDAKIRWAKLELIQEYYSDFHTLLDEVMTEVLGFKCSAIQHDIGEFLANYPSDRKMVQAQRGQAKTTITAAFAVWTIIKNPASRILILSAGSDLASHISTLIIRILKSIPELEILLPDTSNRDRSSVEAFDIHHSLKGVDKSPSICCKGITSGIQGYRADLLIADDIESKVNSKTAHMRAELRETTKDFTSICTSGTIVYLGTPQSIDSIYNCLPSRGYTVRIWTGRYPTKEEIDNYKGLLAPFITDAILANPDLQSGGGIDGLQGRAVDTLLLGEEILLQKELDQGQAYFKLQHQLDTELTDKDRYPLKLSNIIFMDIPEDRVPVQLNFIKTAETQIQAPVDFPLDTKLYKVHSFGQEWAEFKGSCMYIDPAGGGKNGDETAYAITKFSTGTIFCTDIGGIKGGLEEDNLDFLAEIAVSHKVKTVLIEENFGAGALRQVITPIILKKYEDLSYKLNEHISCSIDGVWETGQKELRIISTLEPLIGSKRLVIDEKLIKKDWDSCKKYSTDSRETYSLFFQFARLTREKQSLMHDDKLDALAGSCRYWENMINIDRAKAAAQIKQASINDIVEKHLGNRLPKVSKPSTVFDHYLRRH